MLQRAIAPLKTTTTMPPRRAQTAAKRREMTALQRAKADSMRIEGATCLDIANYFGVATSTASRLSKYTDENEYKSGSRTRPRATDARTD